MRTSTFDLIKHRGTVRKYRTTPVARGKIRRIVEAGRWASSVHGFQPWRFLVVLRPDIIGRIADCLLRRSGTIGRGGDALLRSTAKTIAGAPLIILVYNTKAFTDIVFKFFKVSSVYNSIAELTETQAIAGAIQNMLLTADSEGVGGCWTVTPLFCEKEINAIVKHNEALLGIVTFGYPAEKASRAKRYAERKTVQYID